MNECCKFLYRITEMYIYTIKNNCKKGLPWLSKWSVTPALYDVCFSGHPFQTTTPRGLLYGKIAI